MRNVIWFAALLVGPILAGSASAQNFGMGAQSATRTSNKIGIWDTSTSVSSPFRLGNLFGSFGKVLLPGGNRVSAARMDPSNPKYLSAFGFKKLYGPQ